MEERQIKLQEDMLLFQREQAQQRKEEDERRSKDMESLHKLLAMAFEKKA
jgi:hypothetical protein